MKFKPLKCIVADTLKKHGVYKPKLLRYPGRGDVFNRLSYHIVKGNYGIVREKTFGEELLPGKPVGGCEGVKLLALMGDEKPDSAVVKGRGEIDFSNIKPKYPTFAVDLSLFNILLPRERKSLLVQLEITYGIVKDFFTPENFQILNPTEEAKKALREFFSPVPPFEEIKSGKFEEVIILDPHGDKEFTHEEINSETLIVLGGIVDNSKRLEGATQKILKEAKHRKISYKGSVEIVPDRINEIVKIVLQYLTGNKSLEEVVKQNLTRDSKLRWLRKELEKGIKRISDGRVKIKAIPESQIIRWKEEIGLNEFLIRKAAKHVGGFVVVKDSLFDKVLGKTYNRGKEVLTVKELGDGIIEEYP